MSLPVCAEGGDMALFELSGLLKSVTATAAAVGVVWGGVTVLDARYEMKEVHEPEHEAIQTSFDGMTVSSIKREIREIREQLRNATDPDYRAYLQAELADAIDRLCRISPADRECG